MAAIDTPFPVTRPRYTGILEWVTTVDHKKIGILYLWTTFFFFVTGGLAPNGLDDGGVEEFEELVLSRASNVLKRRSNSAGSPL